MVSVLRKIPIRKAVREKGKSLCVAAAVFFTTVLFVMVFSTLFFVMDAAEEMMKASSPMLSDAMLSVTEEEYERICANPRVAETSTGIIVARMREPSGAGIIPLYDAEEQMARWMRYYPVEGRMPERGNEIVVSDQYLRERGLTYREDLPINLTFTYLDEKEYTETFTVVGVYKRALQPYHAILVSDDFYGKVCAYWEQCGLDPREEADRQAGVMFSSHGNVRRLASMLVMEEEIDLEEGEIYINDISLLSSLDFSTWAALLALVLLVMWLGYLFISNIFHLSVTGDARFFGKLSTNGITKKEIKKLIRRQNNILFLAAVVPALLVGYLFSAAVLPGILSAFMTIQAGGSGNGWIFVLAFAFSYLTVRVSERKPMKLAKNASPVEMKRYIGGFRRVKTVDDGDCLKKFVVRHFQSDKIKVLKVCVSIAVSILLANIFYAVTAGFDVESYVAGDLDADYIFAKESVFTNPSLNPVSYERIAREEIAGCRGLPGVEAAGGASRSHICLRCLFAAFCTYLIRLCISLRGCL
jgi:putative ABC transport system permease protein